MTKLTKNEKILRKASKKWENFLAEGAFNQTQAQEPIDEARMSEYGKMDAEQGLPPTKIGRGNEEYMAAYNAVLVARGEEPLDIQKPDQAFLDALRSGQLEEQEDPKLAFPLSHNAPEVKSLEQGYKKMKDFHNKFPSDKTDKVLSYFLNLMAAIKRAEESLYIDEEKNLKEEITKRVAELLSEGLTPEQVQEKILEEGLGDFIRRGIDTVKKKTGLGKSMATRDSMESLRSLGFEFNEMLEEYLPTPEEIKVMSDVFADYGRSSAGGSSKDPLRQAFSKLPKVKQKVLMNPRILRKQVKTFEKKADEIRDNIQRSGDKTAKKATRAALALLQQIEGMIPFATNLRKAFEEARKTGNAEGVKQLADQQAREHRALMKQIDANTRASAAADREAGRQAKRDARRRDDKEQDIVRGRSTQRFGMATNLEEAREIGEGDEVRIIGGALTGAEGEVIELTKTGGIGIEGGLPAFVVRLTKAADKRIYGGKGDEVIVQPKFVEHKFYSGDFGMELYDIDEKKNLKEEVIEDFEIELEGGLTFADVEEAGLVTPGVDSVIDNGDGYAQVYSEPGAMAKMAKTLEAMTGVMISPKSHGAVDEEMSKKDFVRMVRDKGKVPNLKGDMGPISGLEGPFQYRSGAVLYYDPKAGKYYDRGRDMYLDDQEAANLTMEDRTTFSSDPEFDQVQDIAADMLELSARSRIPVNLKSVQSALEAQSFDAVIDRGMLIVDNKYVIADKKSLPATAQKISFTDYGIDYLSNLQGEQQDLPLG